MILRDGEGWCWETERGGVKGRNGVERGRGVMFRERGGVETR